MTKETHVDIAAEYEVYYVPRPTEMLGLPSAFKWAVARNGDFEEAFRTKREANAYIEAQRKRS